MIARTLAARKDPCESFAPKRWRFAFLATRARARRHVVGDFLSVRDHALLQRRVAVTAWQVERKARRSHRSTSGQPHSTSWSAGAQQFGAGLPSCGSPRAAERVRATCRTRDQARAPAPVRRFAITRDPRGATAQSTPKTPRPFSKRPYTRPPRSSPSRSRNASRIGSFQPERMGCCRGLVAGLLRSPSSSSPPVKPRALALTSTVTFPEKWYAPPGRRPRRRDSITQEQFDHGTKEDWPHRRG